MVGRRLSPAIVTAGFLVLIGVALSAQGERKNWTNWNGHYLLERRAKSAKAKALTMCDEPFYSPTKKPAPPRERQPGELLFEFLKGPNRWLCELRDHGDYGVEAQFYQNEELLIGQRFDTRALAVQWAEAERKAIDADQL